MQGGGDVKGREAGGGQRGAVQFDPYLALVAADDLHLGHAGNGGEAVGDDVVREVVEVINRGVARQEDIGDGGGVDVDLHDRRPLGVLGQLGEDEVELLPDVLRRGVDVGGQVEFEHHLADVVEAGGFDVLEAVNAGDGILDRLGDVLLDILGRGAHPGGKDGQVGDVDRGHVLHRQLAVGIEPEADQGDQQAADRDRASGGGGGKEHQSISGWN